MLPRPATTRWSLSAAFSDVFLPAQAFASIAASNSFPSGSGPSDAQQRLLVQPGARHELHRTEAARIVEGDGRAIRHVEHHMVVRGALGALVIVLAWARCPCRRGTSPTCRDASAARRRTTDRRADISRGGRALDTVSPFSLWAKPFGSGQRRSPRRTSTLRKALAFHDGRQSAAHGFDFGQFGHD